MKKIIKMFICFTLLSFSTIGFAQSNDSVDKEETIKNLPGFQLLLTLDMGYADNSDMDDWASESGDQAAYVYNQYAITNGKTGDFKTDESTGKFIYGVDLEMRFYFGSMGFGFGTGFHAAESKSTAKSSTYGDECESDIFLAVIPLTATVYYAAPVSENSFFVLGAGAGYYYAFLDATIESSTPAGYSEIPGLPESDFMGDSSAVGYHVKAEYNYRLGALCLTGGIMGRYVQFSEFKEDGYALYFKGSKFEAGLTGVTLYFGAGLAI